MLAAAVVSSLPFRVIKTSRKCNKILGSILSQMRLCGCAYTSSAVDSSLFDNPQVQKFLSFISNQSSSELVKSNELQKVVQFLKEKENMEQEIKSLDTMSSDNDDELKKLIESERKQFLDEIEIIKNKIVISLSLEDSNEDRDVELQIISGIGGEEAKLFRNDLFQMYVNYAQFKNWEFFRESGNDFMIISGKLVYGHLKHEGGVHRVQRVPETENFNRVHTSTCSVVVLPQPKPHEVQILDKDLIIETKRSSGAGGQHVNKTESCVRITHIPSGLTVENQTSRFQYENKKIAIDRLRNILFNIEQNKVEMERKNLKKGQAGTNDYADKIRTYNFQQNRVTDHRLNYSVYNMKGFLSGTKDLDAVIGMLREKQKKKDFLNYIENVLQSTEYKNFEKKKC